MITCPYSSDGICTRLQPQVTRQSGDGGHEAHDEGVGLDHGVQLVNDNPAHQLQGHGQQEGGHPLHRQAPGADGVQQTVLNIGWSCWCDTCYSADLVVNLGLLLRQVIQLVHLPPELLNGRRTLETLAAGLWGSHHRGHGQSRAKPRAGARKALNRGLKMDNIDEVYVATLSFASTILLTQQFKEW